MSFYNTPVAGDRAIGVTQMRVMTIKVEEALHMRLKLRAAAANLTISEMVRPLLEEAAWPGGRYVFTGQDELLGVAIQTFALVAELTAAQSPSLLERGSFEARRLMRERGLIGSDLIPVSGDEEDGAGFGEREQ